MQRRPLQCFGLAVVCLALGAHAQPQSGGPTPEARCKAKMSEGGTWEVFTAPPVNKLQADICARGDGQPCTPMGVLRVLSAEELKTAFANFGKVRRVGPGLDAQADICVDAVKHLGAPREGKGTYVPFVRVRRINLDEF